jgi:hypothetical protein
MSDNLPSEFRKTFLLKLNEFQDSNRLRANIEGKSKEEVFYNLF